MAARVRCDRPGTSSPGAVADAVRSADLRPCRLIDMTDTATLPTRPTVFVAGAPAWSETEPFRLVRLYQDADVIGIRLDDGTVKAFNMPGNIDVRRRVVAVLARLDIAATIRFDLISAPHRRYPYTVTGVIEVAR